MKKILLFPYNGNAREAVEAVEQSYDVIGFVDDDPNLVGKKKYGLPIFSREVFSKFKDVNVLAVPGSPSTYLERPDNIKSLGFNRKRFATVIHSSAHVAKDVSVGRNVLVMEGVVIKTGVKIADHVCILPNSVIHHDSSIGEYSLLGSLVVIAGDVSIDVNAYIGAGSRIKNDVKVGKGALVGMGSNVISDIQRGNVVGGNPAKVL